MKIYLKDNLKLIRKSHNLTQKEMAEKIGCTRPAISTYERGNNVPTLKTLLKIRSVFNISLDNLVTSKLQAKIKHEFMPKRNN